MIFFILSGCSGAGKNTIINEVMKNNKNVDVFTSLTTREKRPNEIQGNPYYYVTKEEIEELDKNGRLIEKELIHNNIMATSYDVLEDKLSKGKILIKDIGVEGTFNIIEKLKDKLVVVPIYLKVPKRELIDRITKRGEPKDKVKLRASRFGYENSFIPKYEYVFNHLPLEKSTMAVEILIEYISNKGKKLYSSKPVEKINQKKVEKLKNQFKNGKSLPAVTFAIKENCIVAIKNIESLIAGKQLNAFVQKVFVKKNIQELYETNISLF